MTRLEVLRFQSLGSLKVPGFAVGKKRLDLMQKRLFPQIQRYKRFTLDGFCFGFNHGASTRNVRWKYKIKKEYVLLYQKWEVLSLPFCWSLFDRSSNFNQSAHDSQTALEVHSFASVPRNERYTCVWMVFTRCLVRRLFCFACWEFCNTPSRFVRHRIYCKLNVLFMMI